MDKKELFTFKRVLNIFGCRVIWLLIYEKGAGEAGILKSGRNS